MGKRITAWLLFTALFLPVSIPKLYVHARVLFTVVTVDSREEESEDDFNPDTGEVMLGDIIISVDKVLEQAQSYGHSPKREFAFLIVHSMLHLFGYDHIDPKDASIMVPKQKQILEEMHIVRD